MESKQNLTPEEKWESLTLANNFIFYKVMRHHPDACQHLIELLLGIKIERIEMSNEETIFIDHGSRGIRLDVYVKDTNRLFDVEIQCIDTKDLPERSRYYQSVMDMDTLKSGQQYKELKDSHVIFICLADIFHNDLPICTFENICLEDSRTKLNDRTYKHFFIAKNCVKMIKDRETREFFEFLISNKSSDGFTSALGKYVTDAKHNTQWRFQYMTWERQQAYAKQEGIDETRLETARNLFLMNLLTPEQIAQAVSLPLDEVLTLKQELKTKTMGSIK